VVCSFGIWGSGCQGPHGGVRPFLQKSTCLTQLTYVVQMWSRNPQKFEATKPCGRVCGHAVSTREVVERIVWPDGEHPSNVHRLLSVRVQSPRSGLRTSFIFIVVIEIHFRGSS